MLEPMVPQIRAMIMQEVLRRTEMAMVQVFKPLQEGLLVFKEEAKRRRS
jgi:hypothetical protein